MFETDATSLNRLINCNGSASMAAFSAAIENAGNIIRDEGIAAHYFAVRKQNGVENHNLIGFEAPNGIFMTEEMLFAVDEYLDYINDRIPRGHHFSEMEYDTSYTYEKFSVRGRADNIHHSIDNVLFIDDFKYGYSHVEPQMNWTLISHAIGYCQQRQNQALPDHFVFSIVQPRAVHALGTIRQWKIARDEFLYLWQYLIDTLSDLRNELSTGDHCKRCPSLVYCSAATQAGYNAVEVSDLVFHENLSNVELSQMMDLLNASKKRIQSKLDALEELALHKIKRGEIIENYMPETSLGNTTWQGHVKADLIKTLTGIDVQSGKMVTPNQAKKLGIDANLVDSLTHRPNRGVKLKRVSANEKGKQMFGDVK